MPTRKNTPFNVTLLGAMLALCLFVNNPDAYAAGWDTTGFLNHFRCHFLHANIFHWAANALALVLMAPSPKEILRAFPYAVVATLFAPTPVIGCSAILYAHIGRNFHRWNLTPEARRTFFLANLITLPIPGIAFTVHVLAFLTAAAFTKASEATPPSGKQRFHRCQ